MTHYGARYSRLYPDYPTQSRLAGSMGLSIVEVAQDRHQMSDPPVPEVVFRLVEQSAQTLSRVNCGDGVHNLNTAPGSLYIAPSKAIADWESDGPHKLTMLALSQDRIYRLVGRDDTSAFNPLNPLYATSTFNTFAARIIRQICRESRADGLAATLKVDGLFMTLLGILADIAGSATGYSEDATRPLDQRRLARVVDYIDAHLDAALSVDDLARVACLSPSHFARAFRSATGDAPHGYVTRRRMDLASRLLRDTKDPIPEIAVTTGFSCQSSFTRQFTKDIGMPPGKYRRTHCD